MIAFDEAVKRVFELARPLGSERIALREASGRVLSEDLTARGRMPAHDVSAMDGYAVRAADVGALPASLPVSAESFAGSAPLSALEPETMCRIFTGAPVPDGADCVIIQENVERDGDMATVVSEYGPERHIRKAGSDFDAGDVLLRAGTRLDWKAVTVAAAADKAELSVYRRPHVQILATGDELAEPGHAHERPGAIPESVSLGVKAFSEARGADMLGLARLPDEPETLARAAATALERADIVVVIGGASVGEKDYSRSMFGETLDYVFPKVAIKPGKPVWLARVGERLVLGLPGNPSSALVTARLFLAPLLAGLGGGDPSAELAFETRVAGATIPQTGGRETFYRGVKTTRGFEILSRQDSSSQITLASAHWLIRRAAGAGQVEAGGPIEVLKF